MSPSPRSSTTCPSTSCPRTLREPTWNNTTVIDGDVAAIRDLKDSIKGDVGMTGSATLVRWLLANGLLDRLNLMVHPIALGKGKRLFEDIPTLPLQLLSQETFSTGVLTLGYAPADG